MSGLLQTRKVAKVWGQDALPAPFTASDGERIGEIWFEPDPEFDALLAKYLFTSEKLSVQVHPDRNYAGEHGLAGAKEECWLVLEAEPGASVALGFKEPIEAAAMRSAALDGTIEDLLVWHEARAGDLFHVKPGTVHAIGPGLTLVEIQQNVDITYRLYDYGRPRDLHLEEGMAVARGEPHPADLRRRVGTFGTANLIDGDAFRLDRIEGGLPNEIAGAHRGAVLVLTLSGSVQAGGCAVPPGGCGWTQDVSNIRAGEDALYLIASAR